MRDVGRRFQHHALWRPMNTLIRRFAGVTHRTAALNDRGYVVKPRCCGIDQIARRHRRLVAVPHRLGGQPDDQNEQHRRHEPCPVRTALAGVPCVEPMADRDAHQEHQTCDDPIILGRKDQRVMIGQHQKDHRQRQVIVMRAALLGDLAIFGIRLAPRNQVGHHDALIGNDDEKHIPRHHRGGKGPQMQQCCAARKDIDIEPRHADQYDVKPDHQPCVVIAKAAFADQVIGHPAKSQRGQR